MAIEAPNTLGSYDMAGNVWDWAIAWYGSFSSGSQTDPSGAASGGGRMIRSGCWRDGASYARSAYRYSAPPNSQIYFLGFRLVRRP